MIFETDEFLSCLSFITKFAKTEAVIIKLKVFKFNRESDYQESEREIKIIRQINLVNISNITSSCTVENSNLPSFQLRRFIDALQQEDLNVILKDDSATLRNLIETFKCSFVNYVFGLVDANDAASSLSLLEFTYRLKQLTNFYYLCESSLQEPLELQNGSVLEELVSFVNEVLRPESSKLTNIRDAYEYLQIKLNEHEKFGKVLLITEIAEEIRNYLDSRPNWRNLYRLKDQIQSQSFRSKLANEEIHVEIVDQLSFSEVPKEQLIECEFQNEKLKDIDKVRNSTKNTELTEFCLRSYLKDLKGSMQFLFDRFLRNETACGSCTKTHQAFEFSYRSNVAEFGLLVGMKKTDKEKKIPNSDKKINNFSTMTGKNKSKETVL